MGDIGNPEINDREINRREVLAIESRIDRAIGQLADIGETAYTKRLMFHSRTTENGHDAIRYYSPDAETPDSEGIFHKVAITTNVLDLRGTIAKSTGLARLDYGISFIRENSDEELGAFEADERGGIYGTFYMDKSGGCIS